MIDLTKTKVEVSKSQWDSDRIVRCVAEYLSPSEFECTPTTCQDDTCKTITDILYGSKKIRLGNAPTTDEYKAMFDRVKQFVKIDRPIEILSLWGVLKGYGQCPERCEQVDIMDAMGIRRFDELNTKVRRVFSPGLDVKIIREDVGEVLLTGSEMGQTAHKYTAALDNLCLALDVADHVRFIDESALLLQRGITPEQFLSRSVENAKRFAKYWKESSGRTEEEWAKLQEYASLNQIGWTGTIPSEMRSHYLERITTEHPHAKVDELIDLACTYLGAALARHQTGLYVGTNTGEDGQIIKPIKGSFVPYPPGTPEALRKGRIEYKLKDSKSSNNTVPPWAGFGCLALKEGGYFEPKMLGLRDYRERAPEDFARVSILVPYRNQTQEVRTDVLKTAV